MFAKEFALNIEFKRGNENALSPPPPPQTWSPSAEQRGDPGQGQVRGATRRRPSGSQGDSGSPQRGGARSPPRMADSAHPNTCARSQVRVWTGREGRSAALPHTRRLQAHVSFPSCLELSSLGDRGRSVGGLEQRKRACT